MIGSDLMSGFEKKPDAPVLKIKVVRENAAIPKIQTEGSAGFDLSVCTDGPVTIKKGGIYKAPAGLAIALPSNRFVALVFARSGLATKHGIVPANCVGVIDSDYRGEIFVPLINHGGEDYVLQPGERIAQLVVMPVCVMDMLVCDNLDETERGCGGFGSTGKI